MAAGGLSCLGHTLLFLPLSLPACGRTPQIPVQRGKETVYTTCVTILNIQNIISNAIFCNFENSDHVRLLVQKCPFSAK